MWTLPQTAKETCVSGPPSPPPPSFSEYHTSTKQFFQAYTSTTPSSRAIPKPNSPESSSSARSTKVHLPPSPAPIPQLTHPPSHRPRRPLCPPNSRPRLHRRRPLLLPRIHRPRTPRLRRAWYRRGQQVQNRKSAPCPTPVSAPRAAAAATKLPTDFRQSSQKVHAYDEDATLSVTTLLSLPTCNGRVGTTGMCLGGHLAFRCAFDKRVAAAVCYFATDIHSKTLGAGGDDSLERVGDIKGELVMVRQSLWRSRIHSSLPSWLGPFILSL